MPITVWISSLQHIVGAWLLLSWLMPLRLWQSVFQFSLPPAWGRQQLGVTYVLHLICNLGTQLKVTLSLYIYIHIHIDIDIYINRYISYSRMVYGLILANFDKISLWPPFSSLEWHFANLCLQNHAHLSKSGSNVTFPVKFPCVSTSGIILCQIYFCFCFYDRSA